MGLILLLLLGGALGLYFGFFGERARRVMPVALRYAAIVGGIGFAGGFFGPMILAPGANQGPMLGIFITGPLGFLAGFVYGIVRGLREEGAREGSR